MSDPSFRIGVELPTRLGLRGNTEGMHLHHLICKLGSAERSKVVIPARFTDAVWSAGRSWPKSRDLTLAHSLSLSTVDDKTYREDEVQHHA